MPREIITDWSTTAGGGFATVMYFQSNTFTAAEQRADLAAMWNAFDGQLATATTWNIRTDGRELNDATGVLTGKWLDSTVHTGTGGDAASSPNVDAAQALIRWTTEGVVGGRLVQGRSFVPGTVTGDVGLGNLSPTLLNAIAAAASAFVAAGNGFCIWHRPRNGAGGSIHIVQGSGVWSEWAVLRRRRR